MKKNLLLVLALSVGLGASAQQDHPFGCKANDLHLLEPLHHNDPAVLARMTEIDAELEAFTRDFAEARGGGGGTQYVIPVVFHIIHNNGAENIADEQIHDAMRILNEDFNRENPDWDNVRPAFLDIVANVGVEFRLATKDPQGNCTKGITRTVSPLTNAGDQSMKDLIQWPRNKYLNVWVAASADGAAGYTYRPNAVSMFPTGDGIVMMHTYVGSIGTGGPGRSRALTHEVGHWINLAHTWGNTNEPGMPENCSDDDGVADTPNTIGWTSCTLNGSSCGSVLDNVENFMEYSYCSKMFTNGQATRMIAALNSSTAQRSSLWTASNLLATGVSTEPELCAAAFTSNTRMICAGGTVTFDDISYHGVTSRTWTFEGGSPASATDSAISVTYAAAGTYPVTLQVSDGAHSLSTTTQSYVTVLPNPGATIPLTEGFEGMSSLTAPTWNVVNPNNDNTFQLTTAAAYTGSNSVRIVNSTSMDERTDDLISSTYDMSQAGGILITFRYAYAQRSTGNDDRLRLYVSNNCGATWSMRKQLRGTSDLNTGGTVGGNFVPNGQGQWGYAEVTNISSAYETADFRIRFEFLSAGGNNVYIDDINLNGAAVGMEELALAGNGAMLVVPNPATDNAQAVFELPATERVRMDLLDVLGRSIAVLHEGTLAAGPQRVDLPVPRLRSGMYLVRLQAPTGVRTVRFMVE